MDSRHESYKEALLNQLIITINAYIQSNTDNLLANPALQQQMNELCEKTYHYLGVDVDIDGILSRHNLLSIDVVLFPEVHDPEASKPLKEDEFAELITRMNVIIKKHNHTSPIDTDFINKLEKIVQQ